MTTGLAHALLADRHRLLEQMALGGTGEVWRAQGVLVAPTHTGLPAVDVRAALAGPGLVPRLAYDGSGTPVGTVSVVDPVGRLPVGSEVVLHVGPESGPDRGSAGGPHDAPPGQSRGRGRS
ncbi:hypothetical protein BH24ACT10_BH24ACT10_06500 [soil metagenome]